MRNGPRTESLGLTTRTRALRSSLSGQREEGLNVADLARYARRIPSVLGPDDRGGPLDGVGSWVPGRAGFCPPEQNVCEFRGHFVPGGVQNLGADDRAVVPEGSAEFGHVA